MSRPLLRAEPSFVSLPLSSITCSAYRRGCRVMFGCLLCVVNVECHHQKRCSLNVFIDRRCTPSHSMAEGASSLKENGCPDSDMVITCSAWNYAKWVTKMRYIFLAFEKRSNEMVQNPYNQERLALEHRQHLLHEADHERKLASLPHHQHSSVMRSMAGKLGVLLVMLGTRLKRLEQSASIAQWPTILKRRAKLLIATLKVST